MLRYPCVLFDLDGTLIDSSTDVVASVQYALRKVYDREPPDAEAILIEVGKPLETLFRNFGYPDDPQMAAEFVEVYRKHFAEHIRDHTKPFPKVKETLEVLRELEVKLAVVTTKHQAQAELSLESTGLARFFQFIYGWTEGRKHKPDPEPVHTTLSALKASPDQALFVGDSEQDMLAAQGAGVACCAVTYGYRPAILLRRYRPDFMISRIDDLLHIVAKSAPQPGT